jgi:hypothetical protein
MKKKETRVLSKKKVKRSGNFFDKNTIKENESKINVLTHELLTFTLSYLMLAPC